MLTNILRFVMRFVAGILIQQVLRIIATQITRPPRRPPSPGPGAQHKPKKPKTTIDPKNIVEGRFEDIPEK